MTKQDYQQYIQTQTVAAARLQYEQPNLELYWIIGFLTSQLAEAAYDDTQVLHAFQDRVKRILELSKPL